MVADPESEMRAMVEQMKQVITKLTAIDEERRNADEQWKIMQADVAKIKEEAADRDLN